jgi:hypothetical protein
MMRLSGAPFLYFLPFSLILFRVPQPSDVPIEKLLCGQTTPAVELALSELKQRSFYKDATQWASGEAHPKD